MEITKLLLPRDLGIPFHFFSPENLGQVCLFSALITILVQPV